MQRIREGLLPECPDELDLLEDAIKYYPEFANHFKGHFTSRKKGEHGVLLMSSKMQQVFATKTQAKKVTRLLADGSFYSAPKGSTQFYSIFFEVPG